jgi:hypothetical protein
VTVVSLLIVLGAAGLGAVLVVHRLRRISEAASYCADESTFATEPERDAFALEVAANLFSSRDSDFIASEAPREFVCRFCENRAAIALGWVSRERKRVRCLFRDYRHAVRTTSGLRPTGELNVLGDFILFQLASGLVSCLIVLRGPSHAARFLRWSSDFAGKLQGFAEGAIPASSSTVEVIRPE